MRHRLTMVVVTTVALGGLATPAQATVRPTPAVAASLVEGEVHTPAAATHRAGKLFFLVRVPAKAVLETGVQAPGAPTPDDLDPDPYTSAVGHYWLTPGSVATVAAWVAKHPPVGFAENSVGSATGQETLLFQPISATAGCCTTFAITVSTARRQTAISVATFVQWQPRRAKVEHVPATTTAALLEVGSDPTQALPSFPNTSVDVTGTALLPLTATLNQLVATREVPLPCPYTPNWSKATFGYGGHTVEFASPSACPYVEVMVDGRPSQTLSGNITALVAQILGVTAVPSAT